jgi:hypothetical protein
MGNGQLIGIPGTNAIAKITHIKSPYLVVGVNKQRNNQANNQSKKLQADIEGILE